MIGVETRPGTRVNQAQAAGPVVSMERFLAAHGPGGADHGVDHGRELCRLLEAGKILYFPVAPYGLAEDDCEVLLRQRQTGRLHKNIAYRPAADRITGFDPQSADAGRMHSVLRAFSRRTTACLAALLPHYADAWRLDYASFRPLEEKGRKLRLHARNDLLHVDSFPKRPTYGDRILRAFLNINPVAPRQWITGDPLDVLAAQVPALLGSKLERTFSPPWWRSALTAGRRLAHAACRSVRPPSAYDELMRGLHQKMKESDEFQRDCRKYESSFPPGSAWIVFTDMVPHACLEGRYALEQTFIVPRRAMVCPEKAPAAILERLGGPPQAKAA